MTRLVSGLHPRITRYHTSKLPTRVSVYPGLDWLPGSRSFASPTMTLLATTTSITYTTSSAHKALITTTFESWKDNMIAEGYSICV